MVLRAKSGVTIHHLKVSLPPGGELEVTPAQLRADKQLQQYLTAGLLVAERGHVPKFDGSFQAPAPVLSGRVSTRGVRALPGKSVDSVVEQLVAQLVAQQGEVVSVLESIREEIAQLRSDIARAGSVVQIDTAETVPTTRKVKADDDVPMFIPTGLVRSDSKVSVERSQGDSPDLEDSIARLRQMRKKDG